MQALYAKGPRLVCVLARSQDEGGGGQREERKQSYEGTLTGCGRRIGEKDSPHIRGAAELRRRPRTPPAAARPT
ncbi:hypothetical protein EYF80_012321 [Liparis tanakae]|uniref:Uncharacterized protein n=1 Tax=Liparis tanakae TaxID=230148 RepID=A0A4Z2IIB4_9TELE|nr:hypothetical protein EYF80_012321 [Liparis tanakae]